MLINYKLVCLAIWLSGLCVTFTFALVKTHKFSFAVFYSLFSSISFMGLSVYAKKVYEDKTISDYYKNLKFYGIIGGFVLTIIYALSLYLVGVDMFFWILSIGTVIIGYIIGALIYVFITKTLGKMAARN